MNYSTAFREDSHHLRDLSRRPRGAQINNIIILLAGGHLVGYNNTVYYIYIIVTSNGQQWTYFFWLVCLFLVLSNSLCFNLFLYITLGAGDSCDADGIISSEEQHHSSETVYRGSKGIFHRKQQNPRPANKTNWIDVFTATHCGGSFNQCRTEYNLVIPTIHYLHAYMGMADILYRWFETSKPIDYISVMGWPIMHNLLK